MAKINVNDLRPGMVFQEKGVHFRVLTTEHTKMGRQAAFLVAKVRRLDSGSTTFRRFNGGERVERCHFETVPVLLLFRQGDLFTVMNEKTFDQQEVHLDRVSGVEWLLENEAAVLTLLDGVAVDLGPPPHVVRNVIEAPTAVKGNTATGATKGVVLVGGIEVQAPLFISEGQNIKVDTRTGTYVERA
ncbi:elongation factor P [bacterium]|nr:elongation factor P [bacterium]